MGGPPRSQRPATRPLG